MLLIKQVCYKGTAWILKVQFSLSIDSSSSFYRHLSSLRLPQACLVCKRIFSPHGPPPASLLAPDAGPTVARFSRGLNYEGNTIKLIGGRGQNRPGIVPVQSTSIERVVYDNGHIQLD